MSEETKAADGDLLGLIKTKAKNFKFNTQTVVLLSTIVLWIILGIISEGHAFLSSDNIMNMMKQMAVPGVIGVGALLVILTAGIDLSVGSMIALVNISAAYFLSQTAVSTGMSMPVVFFIVLILGGLMGLVNGLLVFELKLPPFIATLGMMIIWRGIANVTMESQLTFNLPKSIGGFYHESFLGIPFPFWILVIVVAVSEIILRRTSFGRYVYALGSNPEAARLSGVNTRFVTYGAYTFAGTLAGVAGFLYTTRVATAKSTTGIGFELDAISAAVLGGASLMGAEGSPIGAFIGALMIVTINSGCSIMDIPSNYTRIIVGTLLIVTVAVDQVRKRKGGAK